MIERESDRERDCDRERNCDREGECDTEGTETETRVGAETERQRYIQIQGQRQ